MGLVSLLTSVFVVVSTFVSSHVTGFLTPTSPTKNIEGVLSMDNTKEEKLATPSGEDGSGSGSSSVVSNNSVVIDNGDSSVNVEINNGSSSVTSSHTEKANSKTDTSMDNLKYPGASVVESSEGVNLTLESSDSSDAITNWYKSKIEAMGMNTKSFVTTKSNDKVLNKLVGSKDNEEVYVEISHENSSAKVVIKITI